MSTPDWKKVAAEAIEGWSIWEVQMFDEDGPTRHLVGWCRDVHRGARVSSEIAAFDTATRRVLTRSGRVYVLDGPPGFLPDARYTWETWLANYQATVLRELTHELMPE